MSMANRNRTYNDNENEPHQKHRLGIVSNKLLVGLRKPVLRAHNPRPGLFSGIVCVLHLIYTPRFTSSQISNPCVHFSFNYFALNDGSLIFFYNMSSKFAICQCPSKHIRTHNNLCNAYEYQHHFLSQCISCYLTNTLSRNNLPGYCKSKSSRLGNRVQSEHSIFNHCFQAGAN